MGAILKITSNFILLGVVLLLQAELITSKPTDNECNSELDIAIVGAGPSGTYSAYRLRNEGLRIGVFEFSDRVGGRLYTARLPNVPDMNIELGGMRFIVNQHTMVEGLVKELNLETIKFPSGLTPTYPSKVFRRNTSMTEDQFYGGGEVPYALTPEEKENLGDLLGYYLRKLTNDPLDYLMTEEKLFEITVTDGRKLYELSVPEAISLVASPEGKAYLLTEDHMNNPQFSAADLVMFMYGVNGQPFTPDERLTVKDGMSAYPQAALDAFLQASSSHSVDMNHRLVSIVNREGGGYQLLFRKTVTVDDTTSDSEETLNEELVCADRVILAISKFALQHVKWAPLRSPSYKKVLDSTIYVHQSKVFFTFSTPWWQDSTTFPASKVNAEHLGDIFNWGVSSVSGDATILASYTKLENADEQFAINKGLGDYHPGMLQGVFRESPAIRPSNPADLAPINGSVQGENRVTEPLKNYVLDKLSNIFGIDRADIPEPKSAISRFWVEYPFGGAWVYTKPGYRYDQMVPAFRRPSASDEVFVVGSDYIASEWTGWSDGALRSAKSVIEEFFLAEE